MKNRKICVRSFREDTLLTGGLRKLLLQENAPGKLQFKNFK